MNAAAPDLRLKWLLLAAAVCFAFWLLAPVLTPFAVAAGFAYLFDPLADRLERLHLSRVLAASVVFTVMLLIVIAALLLLIPLIEGQVARFIAQIPKWIEWFQTTASPWLHEHFGVTPELPDPRALVAALQAHWKEAGGFAAALIAGVSKSGLALIGWIARLVVIPVVAFYLLRDWDTLVVRVHELIPREVEPTVSRLMRESDQVLGAFMRGQLSVMIALGIYYALGFTIIGIDIGPLIGMIAGLISFVPYLGAITALIMGLIAALVQYQDWLHVILVLVVFAIGQLLEGYVLVPRLVGEKIGLHPVAVIFAVLAGGELFGFLGVLLALPVASVGVVLLRFAHERYTASRLYRGATETVSTAPTIVVADHIAANTLADPPPSPENPPPR